MLYCVNLEFAFVHCHGTTLYLNITTLLKCQSLQYSSFYWSVLRLICQREEVKKILASKSTNLKINL